MRLWGGVKSSSSKGLQAFTLAEVLITLGIIGVVASMTLPTLINRNEEKVTVNKLKKFYSTMNQAYLMSVNDNGYANEWHVENGMSENTANQLAQYIVPYLKILKDCGTQSGCFGYSQGIKLLNGNDYSGNNFYTASYYYKLILADGSYMFFSAENSEYCKKALGGGYTDVCGEVFLDIDGPKGQNTAGRDVFKFYITPKGFMYPNNSDTCSKASSGLSCANYILTHDNMDYLH